MEKETKKITCEELKEVSMPLVELLRRKGHPHMTAVVTEKNVLLNDVFKGLPLERND